MKALLLTLTLLAAGASLHADPAATRAALRVLHPALAERRDFTVGADGAIATWTAPARFTQPTPEQIAATVATIAAHRQQLEALRDGLRQQFAGLAAGEQTLFAPALAAVKAHLLKGDLAAARAVIATIPIPAALEEKRAAMLALFPSGE